MTRTGLSFTDALQALVANKEAWNAFTKIGLPTRQTEAFREVPLHLLYSQDFSSKNEQTPSSLPGSISFTEAKKSYATLLRNHLRPDSQTDPFALLAAALCKDGRFLYIPPNTKIDAPIELKHGKGEILTPHTFIYVGAGSQVSIVIEGGDAPFFSGLTDIVLGDGASVEITQNTLDVAPKTCYFDALRVSLKKDCTFRNSVISQGSKLMRHLVSIDLLGEGSKAFVNQAALLSGERQSHQRAVVRHKAPKSLCRLCTKNVLSGKSRSSVGGCVFVEAQAEQTDAHQLNQNLLLSDSAQAIAKPHMEIFADDVKAAHGATVGQLSDEELFYFKTRGVGDKLAKRLLILGFCKEVIDTIPSRKIQNQAAALALNFKEE